MSDADPRHPRKGAGPDGNARKRRNALPGKRYLNNCREAIAVADVEANTVMETRSASMPAVLGYNNRLAWTTANVDGAYINSRMQECPGQSWRDGRFRQLLSGVAALNREHLYHMLMTHAVDGLGVPCMRLELKTAILDPMRHTWSKEGGTGLRVLVKIGGGRNVKV